MEFVRFTEFNRDGTWNFYIPTEGNAEQLESLDNFIGPENEKYFQLDRFKTYTEDEVDFLISTCTDTSEKGHKLHKKLVGRLDFTEPFEEYRDKEAESYFLWDFERDPNIWKLHFEYWPQKKPKFYSVLKFSRGRYLAVQQNGNLEALTYFYENQYTGCAGILNIRKKVQVPPKYAEVLTGRFDYDWAISEAKDKHSQSMLFYFLYDAQIVHLFD